MSEVTEHWKVGDVLQMSERPCETCGEPHAEIVVKGKTSLMTSWASDSGFGHELKEISWEEMWRRERKTSSALLESSKALVEALRYLHEETYDHHDVGNPPTIGCHDCEILAHHRKVMKELGLEH